ncbi:hypothetical protein KO481_08120 [Nocardia sp. NEAU-G5]|uniref:Transmembrane protein n=1 Tax=Nocardia albiluteola TaxID=2842303 RepID=A0ABS6ATZ0_9NOCA|nr:gephyrin-like molybdotransferase receptor GlpR [Nocardia albiluteola]MBU3061488.1 hypothetical protein [Nocardia albiluteola]
MPNSILWIGLVVLWVFVLFPLLAARYPRIRRTTDTALATRVLHRGGTSSQSRPASGHDSDPDWVPRRVQRKLFHGDDAEDRMTTSADEPVTERDDESGTRGVTGEGEVIEAEVDEFDDAECAGESVIDEAGIEDAEIETGDLEAADPAADHDDMGDGEARGSAAPGDYDESEKSPRHAEPRRAAPPREPDDFAEPEVEYADPETGDSEFTVGRIVPIRRGRGGYDPEADAVARAARYRFRQRTTLGLALSALLFGAFAVAVTRMLWWGCGASVLVLVAYLIYLRRQVRIEEDIRRRRTARLSRGARPSAAKAEPSDARAPEAPSMDRETARDLRRRAVVLDVDDEDPSFDFLETFDATVARATRAGGGEIRRAAGE